MSLCGPDGGSKINKPAKQPPTPFGLLFLLPLCIFCSCLIHICVCQHSATKEKLVISGLSIEHLVGEGNWALKTDHPKDHHLKKAWISYRSCDRDQLGLYANNWRNMKLAHSQQQMKTDTKSREPRTWSTTPPLQNDARIKLTIQVLNLFVVVNGNFVRICLECCDILGHILLPHMWQPQHLLPWHLSTAKKQP